MLGALASVAVKLHIVEQPGGVLRTSRSPKVYRAARLHRRLEPTCAHLILVHNVKLYRLVLKIDIKRNHR
jgi:hypothetical protein